MQQIPYHQDDEAADYGWNQEEYYQQDRPAAQQQKGAGNTGAAGTGKMAQASHTPGQQQASRAVPPSGRKRQFTEKTTLLGSDDEFQ